MNNPLLPVVLFGAVMTADVAAATQANDFEWRGTIAPGKTVEIRGYHGSIRAVTSDNDGVYVDANSGDPSLVRVHVMEHDSGLTFCVVPLTPQGDLTECRPERRAAGLPGTEVRVDFIVRVPAGVRFTASMINGDIEVGNVRSEVNLATIDGNIVLDLPSGSNADFYGNTISGTIDSDFPVYDNAPPVPSGQLRAGRSQAPRIVHSTIGNGGPALRVTTVNGNIRLRRQ